MNRTTPATPNLSNRRLNEADYLPGSIRQRLLEPGAHLIFFGLEAEKPSGEGHAKVFYDLDTGNLYFWNKLDGEWVMH